MCDEFLQYEMTLSYQTFMKSFRTMVNTMDSSFKCSCACSLLGLGLFVVFLFPFQKLLYGYASLHLFLVTAERDKKNVEQLD